MTGTGKFCKGGGGEQVSNQTYFDQKHHRLTDRVHLVWLMFKTNSLLVLVDSCSVQFLSDPGVPGVRSMGPVVCHSLTH